MVAAELSIRSYKGKNPYTKLSHETVVAVNKEGDATRTPTWAAGRLRGGPMTQP